MMKIVTERDISLGRLSQTGKWNIKTVAHDVVYHHLKRRRASWFFSPIFDLTLVCFFMATSNLLLASIDILALSLQLSLTLSMA